MAFKYNRNIGMIVLAIYLILGGLTGMSRVAFPPVILPIMAIVAGILIIIGR
jgi:hypothetical protein